MLSGIDSEALRCGGHPGSAHGGAGNLEAGKAAMATWLTSPSMRESPAPQEQAPSWVRCLSPPIPGNAGAPPTRRKGRVLTMLKARGRACQAENAGALS